MFRSLCLQFDEGKQIEIVAFDVLNCTTIMGEKSIPNSAELKIHMSIECRKPLSLISLNFCITHTVKYPFIWAFHYKSMIYSLRSPFFVCYSHLIRNNTISVYNICIANTHVQAEKDILLKGMKTISLFTDDWVLFVHWNSDKHQIFLIR